MIKKKSRNELRKRRHLRIRKKIFGTPDRPRLCFIKSNRNIYAQLIDDISQRTLTSASTVEKDILKKVKRTGNIEAAKVIGEEMGKRCIEKNIKKVVLDRAGYIYHGKIKAFAESVRSKDVEF